MEATPAATYVVSQQDAAAAPLALVGAKASTLARFTREGVAVPAFFVVSSEAFAFLLAANGIDWPAAAEAPDVGHASAVRDRIRQSPVPEAVAQQTVAAYEALCAESGEDQVAVRSSAGEEDSVSASFAGQFTSLLGVQGPAAVLEAVKACWASSLSGRSLRYRAAFGAASPTEQSVPSGSERPPWDQQHPGFGVVVQAQVRSHKAGVAFTVHPLEPDGDLSYIEANFGTAESVTGGLANPDGITVSRSTMEIVETRIGTKRRMTTTAPDSPGPAGQGPRGGTVVVNVDEDRRQSAVLTDAEAREIAELGLRLEALLGSPQDVEWAFDPGGRLWLLQSRPVTGLGPKEPKKPAEPQGASTWTT